jgi:tape measure domain-containing protein
VDVAQARAVLTMEDSQFQQASRNAARTFEKTAKDIETAGERTAQKVSAALALMGTRLSIGVTAPLAALGAASVRSATQMDSLKRGLTAVAGSSAEAEKQLARLEQIAKLPGLGRVEAIQASTQLQAAGLSAKTAERSLLAFGNALATVGKGKAELDGVTLALTQITAKGKVTAEEINQIAERVPQIRKAMQAAFGTANTEALQKMGIGAKEFVDKINTELLKLPRVTGGVQNAFENMQDAIAKALDTIGKEILPTVLPIVEKLTHRAVELAEAFGRLPAPVRQGILVTAALAAAMGPLLLVTGQLITVFGALKTVLPGAVNSVKSLGAAVLALPGPLKLAGLAVAALGVAWASDFLGMRTATTNFIQWVTPALQATWDVTLSAARTFLDNMKLAFNMTIDGIIDHWQPQMDAFEAMVFTALTGPFAKLQQWWETLAPTIKAALQTAVGGSLLGRFLDPIIKGAEAMKVFNDAMAERDAILKGAAGTPGASPIGGGGADGPYTRDPKAAKQRADTPYEQQWKAYHQALNAARREQDLLMQGASDLAISVANQFSLIDAARQAELVGVQQSIKDHRHETDIWAQFRSELTQAQVKLKDVSGSGEGGLIGLRKRFEGLIPDEVLTRLLEANTAIAQHEERTRKAREEQQRMAQLTESLGQQSMNLSQQLAQMLSPATDAATYAFQRLGLAWDELSASQRQLINDMFGTERQIQQLQLRIDAFRTVAQGIEGVFYEAFANISKGFGGFFSSIVSGFQRMLQQMAAQYLASRLANIFTQFLGGMLGANFGGIFKPMQVPTRQHGGYVGADKPYLVGERGPEYFVPRTAGHIQPMAAGAGGGSFHVTFNIQTPDVGGFQRNQRALIAQAYDEGRRQQRRDGG